MRRAFMMLLVCLAVFTIGIPASADETIRVMNTAVHAVSPGDGLTISYDTIFAPRILGVGNRIVSAEVYDMTDPRHPVWIMRYPNVWEGFEYGKITKPEERYGYEILKPNRKYLILTYDAPGRGDMVFPWYFYTAPLTEHYLLEKTSDGGLVYYTDDDISSFSPPVGRRIVPQSFEPHVAGLGERAVIGRLYDTTEVGKVELSGLYQNFWQAIDPVSRQKGPYPSVKGVGRLKEGRRYLFIALDEHTEEVLLAYYFYT